MALPFELWIVFDPSPFPRRRIVARPVDISLLSWQIFTSQTRIAANNVFSAFTFSAHVYPITHESLLTKQINFSLWDFSRWLKFPCGFHLLPNQYSAGLWLTRNYRKHIYAFPEQDFLSSLQETSRLFNCRIYVLADI